MRRWSSPRSTARSRCFLGALPHPRRCPGPGREADGCLPGASRLLRRQDSGGIARAPARALRWEPPGRRSSPPSGRDRARLAQRAFGDCRPGQRVGKADSRMRFAPHPDVGDLRAAVSPPPPAAICPATLIAELGDVRGALPDRRRPRRRRRPVPGRGGVGQAPGGELSARLRQAPAGRDRDPCEFDAPVAPLGSRGLSPGQRTGKQTHPHALRTLGRAWVRVLWRCWVDRVPYDPTLHGNLRRLEIEGG